MQGNNGDYNNKKIINIFIIAVIVVSVILLVFWGAGSTGVLSNAFKEKIRVEKVTFLVASDMSQEKINGVKQGLQHYGFVEGENVEFTIANAQGDNRRLAQSAQQAVLEKPDVIVATGENEAIAAKEAVKNQDIPIVFIGVGSPVDTRLVKDLYAPGGNITGVENCTVQLSGKRLEYFKRLLPSLNKVTVLYDPAVVESRKSLLYLVQVAEKLQITLNPAAVTSSSQAIQELQRVDPKEGNGAMLLCSILFEEVAKDINPVIYKRQIPLMGAGEAKGLDGLFASYGMPYYEQGIQASRLVAKVLNGENPAFIPVESPSQVELIVNTDIANKLGLNLDSGGLTMVSQFR